MKKRHCNEPDDLKPTRTGEADTEKHQVRDLLKRLGMINRIHIALRRTLNVEDIYFVILTATISQRALDFSRAMLFIRDDSQNVFRYLAALGASDRAQHERYQREIVEEEECLAAMMRGIESSDQQPSEMPGMLGFENEEEFFSRSLAELSTNSFWITIYQKYSVEDTMVNEASALKLDAPPLQPMPRELLSPQILFLDDVLNAESSKVFTQEQLKEAGLNEEWTNLLSGESLWAAIRTQKGAHLLLIADRAFQDEPINQAAQMHVDWLISQVALTLENAEMVQELEESLKNSREMDRLKSSFLATISHELRTPLTSINGYALLLLGNRVGPLSPGQREVIERIRVQGESLTGKLNDLIEVAEMDAGQATQLPLETVDPLNVIMTVLPKAEARYSQKGIVIEPKVGAAIPCILSNPDALERIFFHLLDNALKFGRPQGHVEVHFQTVESKMRISIVDDGIGVPPEQLNHIFKMFYQVDNELARNYEGLGIGLAVTMHQLSISGGTIEVESTPGQGSTFTVTYPLA